MATAFFDITGKRGDLYVFEGRDGRLRETIAFEMGEDHRVRVGDIPQDITESYVSLPLELLDFRVLDFPFEDMEKVRDVLPYELQGLMLRDPQSVVFDARAVDGKVLAAYVEKSALGAILSSLDELGVDPRAATSIDLGAIIRKSSGENALVRRLGEPVPVQGEERVSAAMRELDALTVDFRRGEFAYKKEEERARKSLRLSVLLAVVLILVFSADMAVRTMAANRRAAAVERSILRAYSQAFPGREASTASGLGHTMRSELKALREKAESVEGASALDFLMKLQELASPSFTVSQISLGEDAVVLKGDADTLSDVQRLKGQLQEFVDDVAVAETGQSAQGKVAFTINAKRMKE